MDVLKVKTELKSFIRRHRSSFQSMAIRETALLEMGALVLTSEHYRLAGYTVDIVNDRDGFFVVKLTSRGYPYNFSWFTCSRSDAAFEIHSNLAVGGAHKDEAVYVVDVAVVKANKIPRAKEKKPWICLDNADLVTFVEAQKTHCISDAVGTVHRHRSRNQT